MQVRALHRWDLPPAEAVAVQQDLRGRVVLRNELGQVRTVAGVDISTAAGRAHAAIGDEPEPGAREMPPAFSGASGALCRISGIP